MNQRYAFIKEIEAEITGTFKSVGNYITAWTCGIIFSVSRLLLAIIVGSQNGYSRPNLDGNRTMDIFMTFQLILLTSIMVFGVISVFKINALLTSIYTLMSKEEKGEIRTSELIHVVKSLRMIFIISFAVAILGLLFSRVAVFATITDVILFSCAVIFRNKLKKFMIPEIWR